MTQQALPFEVTADTPSDSSPDVSHVRSVRLPPSSREATADHRSLGGGGQPDYIRHPRARRYVVRVRSDGTVRVTIPRWGSKREAVAFAEEQRGWIDKQLARLQAERLETREQPSQEETRALQSRAKRELPDRLLHLAAQFGLRVSRVSIRNQQSRWGSCSPNGHICLNWRLVTMPDWVRDYVIVHELMHLKRLDHSAKFWKLVAAACPQYQEARAWLRKYRGTA
jgi:predicted metal-dependent hydrolase